MIASQDRSSVSVCRPVFWYRTLAIALRDPRLPAVVRTLACLALLYFACPFDFKPDFLPGGFVDDSIISPLLLLLAFFRIPKCVLGDAKRLALQTRSGFVCVALCGVQAAMVQSPVIVPGPAPVSSSFIAEAVLAKKISSAASEHKQVQNCDSHQVRSIPLPSSANEIAVLPASVCQQSNLSLPVNSAGHGRSNAHGQQRKLCQSGDDPSSSCIALTNGLVFEPLSHGGGSFDGKNAASRLRSAP